MKTTIEEVLVSWKKYWNWKKKKKKWNEEIMKKAMIMMITGIAFVNQKESLWKYKNLWIKKNSYVKQKTEKKNT